MTEFDMKYSALRQSVIEEEFSGLNDRQREAVFCTEGPLLLLAGAGSGKTTVLINRIINLLKYGRGYEDPLAPEGATQQDLKRLAAYLADPQPQTPEDIAELCAVDPPLPWQIIAITFTNKAAGELKDRLEAACGDAAADIWAYTFHSACIRILRRFGERIGYGQNFTIYDEDDKKKLLGEVLRDLGYDDKKFDIRGVIGEMSRAKDQLIGPEQYQQEAGEDYYRRSVGRIYQLYQQRMQAADALDFDDIIMQTVRLLQTCQEARGHYQRQFRYVLVDEYQDTNHAQYMLCSLLAGGSGNICVVGDDDQSIYKFRGATIANILEFEQQYDNARTIRLEQNYRSTTNILDAANQVIAHNSARKGKKLWTENGDGEKISYFNGENQEEEGQYVASEILKAYAGGAKFSDFAVLYRNHALSNSIEAAFKRSAVPYRMVSGLRFFDRAEVKDMLAYLWVIANPSDTVRLRRIVNNPARKIGGKTLDTVARLAAEEGIGEFEIIARARQYGELARAHDALESFAQLIQGLRELSRDCSLSDLYEAVLEKSGYLQALQHQNTQEAQGRIDNIMELKSNIAEFESTHENGSLAEFLEEIALFTDIDRYDQQADAVTMMTMHSAKGLEFPTVFLCGVEEGLFPSYRSMDSEEELEEERRICYVAMTRAKRKLHISCVQRRMLYGQTTFAKPSRFIEEIPEERLEKSRPKRPAGPSGAGRPAARMRPTGSKAFVSAFVKPAGGQKDLPNLRPGQAVVHKSFGQGRVLACTPMGNDVMLEIKFQAEEKNRFMMLRTAQEFLSVED